VSSIFADGERAAKLEALDASPAATPAGVTVRRDEAQRLWTVTDRDGRVLNTWATKRAAQEDAAKYQRAEVGAKRGRPARPLAEGPTACRVGCGERGWAHYNHMCRICWKHQQETGEVYP
jgi:hypothetical protein